MLRFLFILVLLSPLTVKAQLAEAIPTAHAHNDYEKLRPSLYKALRHGFCSVEIDVFPYKGKMKVAHVPLFLNLAQDIEVMYFEKLDLWIQEYQQVFQDSQQQLIFMIDVKRDADKSYELLREICVKYHHLMYCYYPEKDSIKQGPLRIILSGAKPYKKVLNDSLRYMQIDGSFGDVNSAIHHRGIAPRVSTSYRSFFKWRGHGDIPQSEAKKLKDFIDNAHRDGRKVRFWGMPNKKKVWRTLLDLGVDWMNVDRLRKYQKFWLNYQLSNGEN